MKNKAVFTAMLLLCLATGPSASAAGRDESEGGVVDRVVRFLKFVGQLVTILEDYPVPPKP